MNKVEVFGDEYIGQFVANENRKQNEYEALRIYVTDVLKLICENTAKIVGGSYVTTRYGDIIDLKKSKEPDETAEQVKTRLLAKFRKDFESESAGDTQK